MPQSSFGEQKLTGKIDDEHVEYTYAGEKDGNLRWRVVSTGEERVLDSGSVIATIERDGPNGVSLDANVDYTILHMTTGHSDPEDEKQNFSLESTQAAGLPSGFLNRYLVQACPAQFSLGKTDDRTVNFHVIISTRSGTGFAQAFLLEVVEPTLFALGLLRDAYAIHETRSDQTITELARSVFVPRANAGIRQTIILLSGDGGMVDIINVLLSFPSSARYVKPAVGLLALGTGNALAHSINPCQDSTFGLASIVRGTPQPLPTFIIRFSPGSVRLFDEGSRAEPLPQLSTVDRNAPSMYGVVVCSWGLHASLVADSDTAAYRKYGAERFQMAAKELLSPADGSASHRYRGKVSLLKPTFDGHETWELLGRQEHMYILATLVSNLTKTLTISPSSKTLDGQLRLVHFGPIDGDEVMRIMAKAEQGGLHVGEDAVGYEDIAGLRIEFEEDDARWRRVCVDGNIVQVNKGGWVEVRREPRDVLDIIAAS